MMRFGLRSCPRSCRLSAAVLCPLLAVLAMALAVPGCDSGGEPSLESFRNQWHAAVNAGEAEQLYALLDADSRRRIEQTLQELRGLDSVIQRQVIAQLGGDAIDHLVDLGTDRYFALLWDRVTRGRRPTMQIEALGRDSAVMVLAIGPDHVQRITLSVEGGRWVWRLPPQHFGPVDDPARGPVLSHVQPVSNDD
jgi:hypothetical protein